LKQGVIKKGATRLNGTSKTASYLGAVFYEVSQRLNPQRKLQIPHQQLAATLCINCIFHLELQFIALSLCAFKTKTTPNRNIYLQLLTSFKVAGINGERRKIRKLI